MGFLVDSYRKLMPINLRYKIGKYKTKRVKELLFERVESGEWDREFKEECDYMRSIGRVETFPYRWIEQYDKKNIQVHFDKTTGLPYVLADDKRLYFPKRYPEEYIKIYFNSILIEQDPRSAHYYFNPKDDCLKGAVFIDVGGAEGYISLLVVDAVKKLIIFESDVDWIDALNMTFAPWKRNVTIVNKYADSTTEENRVRIDDFVEDNEHIVIKMDVEGMERACLAGARAALSKSGTRAFICAYHRPDDEMAIINYLKGIGMQTEVSDSYMFYGGEDAGFRKGVVRGYGK